MPNQPTLRPMRPEELAPVLGWAAEEGWNPGREDAAPFFAADPEGFFVAELDGAPVAAISVVNHSAEMAFLGLYLCRPAYRGRGIGYALWRHALDHAGGRTVGLDGVAAQQANYARSGFVLTGATLRWEGRLAPQPDPQIRLATPADAAAIAALDRNANGYARPRFLAAWTAPAESRRTLVLETEGVAGFTTVRRCGRGCKIGPLIAPDAGAAWRLIGAALAEMGEELAVVDVPEANTALAGRLEAAGFGETFRTARMYRGPAPVASALLQGVGTLELG
jgi:predicted N-acetyltransferase YhbS